MPPARLTVAVETFPIAGTFTIARGSRTEATVVVVTIDDGTSRGRGEAVPYARYGESVEGVVAQIEAAGLPLSRADLLTALPAGAARNAIDCALWDFEAKQRGVPVAALAHVVPPATPQITCFTLSLDRPEIMAAKARAAADKRLLKIKLGASGDADRMRALRQARPDARLVADANEGWSGADLATLLEIAAETGFELIEQPLPAGEDEALRTVPRRVAVCADESAHTATDIPRLAGLYDAVNIKLDKAGGLTAALAMADAARMSGLTIMVGCMVATSLAMAPAWLLTGMANWIDLDGPLLLARDRAPGIDYHGDMMQPPPATLWG
ncbi:MAG: N-acetyl-D-Glu racemase DgcA [Hyphomicrobiaceae bacterium]